MQELLNKNRIILKLGKRFYAAEIFKEDKTSIYDSSICAKCKHKVLTYFYADFIPLNITSKVDYIPDMVLDYSTQSSKLKFLICDKCFNVHIIDDVVKIIGNTNKSYIYKFPDKIGTICLSETFYNELKLCFWQTSKDPMDIIMDKSYHSKLKKYFTGETLENINTICEKLDIKF